MLFLFHGLAGRALFLIPLLFSILAIAQSDPSRLQSADAAFRAGYAAVQSGNLNEARKQFQSVTTLAPAISEGHSALGAVLVQLGALSQAIAELKHALVLNKKDAAAQTNLAMAYEQTGNHKQAIRWFEAVEGRPAAVNARAALLFARALVADGQVERAQLTLQKLVEKNPGDAKLLDALGSVEAQQDKYDAAENEFNEAIRLAPAFADPHIHLGIVLAAKGRTDAALENFEAAAQIAPKNLAVKLELGKHLISAGDGARAVEVLQSALALAPSSLEIKYQLALALQAKGEERASIPLLQSVIDANQNHAAALTNLGLALVQTGKAKEAVTPGSQLE